MFPDCYTLQVSYPFNDLYLFYKRCTILYTVQYCDLPSDTFEWKVIPLLIAASRFLTLVSLKGSLPFTIANKTTPLKSKRGLVDDT